VKLLTWKNLHLFPLPAEFTAEVTAEDIEQGVKGSCTDCAISRAVCRALGLPLIGLLATSMTEVSLYREAQPNRGYVTFEDTVAEYTPLPEEPSQANFVVEFDYGSTPQPTRFRYSLSEGINYEEKAQS